MNAEKLTMTSDESIVEAVGYLAGSDTPVFSKTYTTAGTGTVSDGIKNPGDVAAVVRYSTTARSSKNHPIYLYNYYHHVQSYITNADEVSHDQKTLLETYATAWISTGFSDGTNTYNRAGPNGATATARTVKQYLSHRDFPR